MDEHEKLAAIIALLDDYFSNAFRTRDDIKGYEDGREIKTDLGLPRRTSGRSTTWPSAT